ncbi:hypothetical protein [Pararhodospirillum oryzae]|nr:hypothetical protein [Pararhodospirillum oryzae]
MTASPQAELYIDGLLDVSFARGTVRIDLYSLSATAKASNGQPLPEHRQRLILSVPSFLDFVGGLNMAAGSFRDKGVLPGTAPAAAPEGGQAPPAPAAASPEPAPASPAPAVKRTPSSPNFAPVSDSTEA